MSETRTRIRRTLAPETDTPLDTGRVVLGVALLCVVAQVAVRGWALYGNWFYLDDYVLIDEARGHGVSGSYLLTSYNDHLMPGGRLLMSWLAAAGPLDWGLAATATLVVQALAGLAAVWGLVVIFGRRWAVLVPLNLFLWSAITVPAMMWLSGAVLLVPQELSFWIAVGAWVSYLRTRSARWLALTVAGVALGLAFDVKSILTVAVLVFIVLAYFSEGGPLRRTVGAVRRYWPAAIVVGLATLGYLVVYLTHAHAPFRSVGPGDIGALASTMLGSAFASAAVGGPWQWSPDPAPAVYADPPAWAQHLAWVILAGIVAVGWLRRTRTGRAWVLLVGYLVVLLLILATSRGSTFGAPLGGEYRYLNDSATVLALCVALAFLPLPGATQSSDERGEPLLLLDLRVPAACLVGVICMSSLVSSLRYVHVWHTENASKQWFANLRDDLGAVGPVDLADTPVPDRVMSQLIAPRNSVADLAPLASDDVSFPTISPQLLVVGDNGRLRQAAIELGVASQPGPRPGCGWLVREPGKDVPLTGRAFAWTWWLRIGYLAGQDSPVTVVAGDSRVSTTVRTGLNNLYVRVDGTFDSVRIEGLDAGASMCVSTIEVGQPVPGGAV